MPPANARRQPDTPADAWFRRDGTLRMMHEVQRHAVPELTRVFGHSGLYLRPSDAVAATLSGNMLASIVSLYRTGSQLDGDLACQDVRLPIATGSLSLVYGLFVFETSPDPAALLAEITRTLKPEGTALLVTLNPWSPCHLRWSFKGLSSQDPTLFAGQVRDAGLEVQRRRNLGPAWSSDRQVDLEAGRGEGLSSTLGMASLVVARRREAGITPLRAGSSALKFRPGMSAG